MRAEQLFSEVTRDISSALQPLLSLSAGQRGEINSALTAWVRARLAIPDTDPRAAKLLASIHDFANSVTVQLRVAEGLVVETSLKDTALLLERGSRWFRGGEWRIVITTCVSKETTSQS